MRFTRLGNCDLRAVVHELSFYESENPVAEPSRIAFNSPIKATPSGTSQCHQAAVVTTGARCRRKAIPITVMTRARVGH